MTAPYAKPIRSSSTLWAKFAVFAERPSSNRSRVKHPVTGGDLGDPNDRLTRVKEKGHAVYWHVGYGYGSDGCAYGGGMIFKTKRAALAVWGA